MVTKLDAIRTGFQLPDGTLELADVLIAIDFIGKPPSEPVRGGEFANSEHARNLRALGELVGMTLQETIWAMKARGLRWTMRDYHCHVARGRCVVARNGKLIDNKGNVTTVAVGTRVA